LFVNPTDSLIDEAGEKINIHHIGNIVRNTIKKKRRMNGGCGRPGQNGEMSGENKFRSSGHKSLK